MALTLASFRAATAVGSSVESTWSVLFVVPNDTSVVSRLRILSCAGICRPLCISCSSVRITSAPLPLRFHTPLFCNLFPNCLATLERRP
mmetsp:Transcript_23308/g.40109  ORF Transcript_23308/g.40109 Transcript_23308/m.40109 type:complete len:89 (+) Transcript_23308:631-897(+)